MNCLVYPIQLSITVTSFLNIRIAAMDNARASSFIARVRLRYSIEEKREEILKGLKKWLSDVEITPVARERYVLGTNS